MKKKTSKVLNCNLKKSYYKKTIFPILQLCYQPALHAYGAEWCAGGQDLPCILKIGPTTRWPPSQRAAEENCRQSNSVQMQDGLPMPS